MAKKKGLLESELENADYMTLLNGGETGGIFTKNSMIDYSYPTGVSLIDYTLGYEINIRDENDNVVGKRLCLGLQAGSFNVITGRTQSFKTTISIQIISNIAYANGGNIIHYDAENRLVLERVKLLSKLPESWFSGDTPRYSLRSGAIGFDTLQNDITQVYENKMRHKDLLIKDTGVLDSTGKPIKLTGTGEKLNALEDFYPERMATRILGMGDIVSLVERAQEVFDEKEALKFQEKMEKEEFSFNDFLNMQKQMKMFGSMDQILGMIPGVNLKQADREKISHASETEFKKIEVFIQSMTPEERDNPHLMNTSRKKRIAKGCGMDLHTINLYVKQFEQMRQMMGGMNKMQKMFGGFGKMNEKKAMVKAMNMLKRRRF